ncbi:unnamed protein product [Adineta steineri]|uniref:EGF-like domain-containing protein n=1 Tax=Adineta steineri TaxID=433720 RepID=A0A819AXB7_9BILA|nr:unnamed protein product [Adineta steineri]
MSDEATKQLPSHNQYQTVSISNDHWVPVARNRLSKRCRILLGVFAVIGITMLLLALLLPTLLINGKSTSFTIITTTTTIITKTTSTSTIASSTSTLNPVRRTTMGACMRRTPCENRATCVDRSDKNYKCLCSFSWQGRHCNERFQITFLHFNRQSYSQLKLQISTKHTDNQLLRIDLIFASEHHNGLLLYADDKLTEFYFIISIRNKILDITVRLDHSISTIQLPNMIELDKYARFHLDEGFQGCIHELSINERRLTFNNSEHNTILSTQNIDECVANPCRSDIATCRNETRYIPIRNNDANSYKSICDAYLSSTNTDCLISSIDRCATKSCYYDQQCINVYPDNYTCVCLNCSSDNPYIARFHANSYIKRSSLQPVEHTGKFSIELCSRYPIEIHDQKLTLTVDQEPSVVKKWTTSSYSSNVYIGNTNTNSFSQYVSLTIVDGFIQFTVKLDKNSDKNFLISKIRVDDGQWYRVEIERFLRRITMKLDDNSPRRIVSSSRMTEFRPYPTYIYIGGYHHLCSYNEQYCHTYRGCLKNFFIDKYFLDLLNDEINQQYSLKQCQTIAG